MLHTKNFGLLEFALQLEPTAVGLRAAAGARAQSSFLSETRGSQISPPIRTGRDDERSPAIGVQHRPEHRLCRPQTVWETWPILGKTCGKLAGETYTCFAGNSDSGQRTRRARGSGRA